MCANVAPNATMDNVKNVAGKNNFELKLKSMFQADIQFFSDKKIPCKLRGKFFCRFESGRTADAFSVAKNLVVRRAENHYAFLIAFQARSI